METNKTAGKTARREFLVIARVSMLDEVDSNKVQIKLDKAISALFRVAKEVRWVKVEEMN